jgi:hypothetical protein
MAGGQPGALGNLFVGKVFVELQPDYFTASFVEGAQAQAHQPDALPTDNLFVGQRFGVGGVVALPVCRFGQRDDFAGLAAVIEGQVMNGAIQPASGFADFGKLGMQFHESFLDDILRGDPLAQQPKGVAQERRFESEEQLLHRFESRRFRAGGVRTGHSHSCSGGVALRHPGTCLLVRR